MPYSGSSAASSVANPPLKIADGIWGKRTTDSVGSTKITGRQMWLYYTTDDTTGLTSANYFTDAKALGMQPGDLVFAVGDTGSTVSLRIYVLGQVTTAGAAALSTGSMITSTF